jgi:hypothetical protein
MALSSKLEQLAHNRSLGVRLKVFIVPNLVSGRRRRLPDSGLSALAHTQPDALGRGPRLVPGQHSH